MTQYVKTVLEVDASRAVAGFKQGENAVNGYEQALKGAGAQAGRSQSTLGSLSDSIRQNREEWDRIGDNALIAGGAITAGLGLAAKAAIDWETAWAGVMKTTDGTPEQMAALEEELRGLATTLPATHEEIAGVAEAAGQLGIARQDIADFTETAIALGESTNLSAEEAATGLAKISNVMGTQAEHGIEGIERMGSALVALGNDGASTEADILAMGQRIAGAGETVGATEADVLALANALSSVGIEAQLGGGAMSRAMLEMNSAVLSGGEELEKFAEISGMTSQEFASSWREDPVAAIGEFVGGLGRISEGGGDAAAALESVGLRGTENAQVFLRAAGASDMLIESLELGATAWEENTALSEEAAQRYETDAARIQVAWNRVKDATIDAGASIAPVVVGIAEGIATVADTFNSLPGPAQSAITGIAGVTGAALLLGGGAVKAVGFAQDISGAFSTIGGSMDSFSKKGPRAAKAMDRTSRAARGLGKAIGGAAIAGVALGALQGDLEGIAGQQMIRDLRDTGDAVESINRAIADADNGTSDVQDIGKALQVAFDPNWIDKTGAGLDTFFSIVSMGAREADGEIAMSNRRLAELDEIMAGMVSSGNLEGARQMMDAIEAAAREQGISVEDLAEKFPLLGEAYAAADNQSAEFNEGLGETEDAAADAEAALDDLRSQIEMLGGGLRGERAAVRDYEDALKAVKEAAPGSEFEAALDQMAQSALDVASAQIEMGRSSDVVAADMAAARKAFIDAGVAAGESRPYMKQLADEMGLIPSEVKTMISQEGAGQAKAEVMALDGQIKLLNGKTVSVEEAGAIPAKGRVLELDGSIFGLKGKTVEVTEIGSTASGDRVVSLDGKIYRLNGKTVQVNANVRGEGRVWSLNAAINNLRSRDIYINNHVTTSRRVVDLGTVKAAYQADGGVMERAAGGLHRYMADGGTIDSFRGQQPHVRAAGGAGVTWAEDGAGPWEAWISGHPAKVSRSKAIADDVVARLGGATVWPQRMADGGMRDFRHYTPAAPAPVVVQAPRQAPGDVVARLHPADIKAIVAGVQQGAYAGTSLQRRNEYAQAATTPRGRGRG